ncbi:MAG: DUF3365 domain-containing protein [Candidatus Riflebacteria bacterium]|nr:DUF3365 domain-containing protein [Candidatus Riflebacteria bacterium]
MKRRTLVPLIFSLIVTVIASGVIHYTLTMYFIRQAKDNITNILLFNKELTLYIKKIVEPAVFEAIRDGRISKDFYDPKLLSVSHTLRSMHELNNEIREKRNLVTVYYKLASNNPRNPVNKADEQEAKLIKFFNENPDIKEYEKLVEVNGKNFLYYAKPFPRNNGYCLGCHSIPEKAPLNMRKLYPQGGGFYEKFGEIRGIESLRSPIEYPGYMTLMVTGSAGSGLLTMLAIFFFRRLFRADI